MDLELDWGLHPWSPQRERLAIRRGSIESVCSMLKNCGVGGKGLQRIGQPRGLGHQPRRLHLTAARVAQEAEPSPPRGTSDTSPSPTTRVVPLPDDRRARRAADPPRPDHAAVAARPQVEPRGPNRSGSRRHHPLGRLDSRRGRASLCQLAQRSSRTVEPPLGKTTPKSPPRPGPPSPPPETPAITGPLETPSSLTPSPDRPRLGTARWGNPGMPPNRIRARRR